MARIRSIHPDACKSEKLDAATAEAERCYWRLQPHCDDDGRAEDDPRLLRSAMFPLSETVTAAMVDGWLGDLERLGLVIRYVSEGRRCLCITRWEDYQKPQRHVPSKLPPIPEDYVSHPRALTEPSRTPRVHVSTGEGVGEGVGEGDGVGDIAPAKRVRARDDIFETLCEETGIDPSELTAAARGPLNRAVKELKMVGALPPEIRRRRAALSRQYPTIRVTPSMLVKHWASFGNGHKAQITVRTLEDDQAEWAKLTAEEGT